MVWIKRIGQFLAQYWFFLGMIAAVGLAAIYPPLGMHGGILRTEYSVSYGVVILLFLQSGLSLRSKVLLRATLGWRLHFVVQLISFGLAPLLGYGVARILAVTPGFDLNLAIGILVFSSLPTTISSSVLLTKQSNGNEAAALVNSVIGGVLGVFISPTLIIAFVFTITSEAKYTVFDYSTVFIKLAVTVVVPFSVGRLLRVYFPDYCSRFMKKIPLKTFSSLLILVLVWSVMSEAFSSKVFLGISPGELVSIVLMDLAIFLGISGSTFLISLAPIFRFTRADRAAIVMCCATKSVAFGVPVVNIIFDQVEEVGILTIPLLVYYAEQLIFGQILASKFRPYIGAAPEEVVLDSLSTSRKTLASTIKSESTIEKGEGRPSTAGYSNQTDVKTNANIPKSDGYGNNNNSSNIQVVKTCEVSELGSPI